MSEVVPPGTPPPELTARLEVPAALSGTANNAKAVIRIAKELKKVEMLGTPLGEEVLSFIDCGST
ncbi:MAG: hypothetical protein IH602_00945 [Bryobacteraceae bacterium]|nr:hypothetical protein [Bryobacteraceae bacterium]